MVPKLQQQAWVNPSPKSFSWKPERPAPVRNPRRGRAEERHRPDSPRVTTSPCRTLVWIDDYEPVLTVYKALFESLGFRVLTASQGTVGLGLIASNAVDAVVVDYEMPEMDGRQVATAIKTRQPELPVILFSGSNEVPHRVKQLFDAVCDKAGSRDQLLSEIHRVLEAKENRPPVTPAFSSGREQRPRAVA
jgi:CheY-like chemotaxis protein